MRDHRCLIAFLALAATLSGCRDLPTVPSTGTLELGLVTTGEDIDSDGFLMAVDGGSPQMLPANGIVRVIETPGTHTLALSGEAFNCDIAAVPASVSITAGETMHVNVLASCAPFLRNTIVYTSDEFGVVEVMVMRPDGSRRQRLTTDQQGYAAPVISPDGRSIAVASYLGGSWGGIYLLDRFGHGRTKLVGLSDLDGSPAWSPDGATLAFQSELPGPYGSYGRIFLVNRDGSNARQLSPETGDYSYDDGPSWSPDGTRLVFSRNGTLFVIGADGSGLTSLGIAGMHPSWSPDGTHIAYDAWVGNAISIFVADANGGNLRRLTTSAYQDQMARWSPDGNQILFERAEGVTHLYAIRPDGTGEAKIGSDPHNDDWASWGPS